MRGLVILLRVIGYVCLAIILAVIMHIRLTHPELTETQLSIQFFRVWLSLISVALCAAFAFWFSNEIE